jgi:hypothetical protein
MPSDGLFGNLTNPELEKSMPNATKMKMSSEDREEFFAELKTRFEKNMDRHKGLEWAKVQARLEADPKKLWSLSEMETTGGDPMLSGLIKSRASTFFTIVRRKALKAAEVFATTGRLWTQGKKINRKTAWSIWRPPWALSS